MTLGKNFVIYIASSMVSGALPLVLMPFLTHNLAPVQYGAMVTITTIVAMITPLIAWTTTGYVGVQYFKVETSKFPYLLSSVLLIPVANTAILLVLFVAGRRLLQAWFDVPPGWDVVMPLMAAAILPLQIVQTILAMRDRAVGYALLETLGAAINFGGTILLVLWLGYGWEGRILAAALASAVLGVVSLIWLFRQGLIGRHFSLTEFIGALRFGSGGVANDLAVMALRLGDRLLILALLGRVAVGTYAVAVQWSSIMLFILAAFNRAWTPYLFSALSNAAPGWAERIVRQTYLIWGLLLLLAVSFSIATPVGYHLLIDVRYHSSMSAALWLTFGYFFNGIYMTVVDYIFYFKKTHILAMITVFNLVLNVGLAYVLIGIYGSIGAAIAFATTAFIVVCLTFIISNRLQPMPWLRAITR